MTKKPVEKFYCYVDETGQDTEGKLFIVAVIVTGQERDELLTLCEQLESVSGKGKFKWSKARHDLRMRYLRHIFADDRFAGNLRYCVFRDTQDYDTASVEAIAKAVLFKKPTDEYTTRIYVDGLTKTKRREYGARLRKLGLRVRQVRGVARDESNALIRLADTIAGFVRAGLEGKSKDIQDLFERVQREGVLVEVET
jgi:hypothetical protein